MDKNHYGLAGQWCTYAMFADFLFICRRTFDRLVREGKAPSKNKVSRKTVLYRVDEVVKFLNDPANYHAA